MVFEVRPVSLIDLSKGHLIIDSQRLRVLAAQSWRHYDSSIIVETDKALVKQCVEMYREEETVVGVRPIFES